VSLYHEEVLAPSALEREIFRVHDLAYVHAHVNDAVMVVE
jgi:hypothetical protein